MPKKSMYAYILMTLGVTLIIGGGLMLINPAAIAQAAESTPAAPAEEFLPSPPAQGDPGKGGYIFALAGGCGCHMGQAGFLAGGAPFEGPFGIVYPSNITQDEATGIGAWTDQQIIEAVRLGHDPDGGQLFPIMPYPAFSGMSDEDVTNLVAFLRTVPAIANEVPEPQLNFPAPPFEPPFPAPATAPTTGVDRGAYIANHVAHCGDCHTPRTADGAPDFSMNLAGAFIEGQIAPNISPDEATGIGAWSEENLINFFKTGQRPEGPPAGGLMALIIEGGLKNITDEDAQALVAYLKSLPAVENVPQAPEAMAAPAEGETAAPAAEAAPATLPVSGGENRANMAIILLALGLILTTGGFWAHRAGRVAK